LGNFVRGLALIVSGFTGMSLCMNYASSSYSSYLVPVGLGSVSLGVVGFVVMVSGMNHAINDPARVPAKTVSDPVIDMVERPRMGESMDLGRLDDPTAKKT
jgi:hypothetical protein